MHSYVLSKLTEQQDRPIPSSEAVPCPICKRTLLPEEIEAAIGEGLAGENTFSKFLLEEAQKLPGWSIPQVRPLRCWCHVVLLLLAAAVYVRGLVSNDYLLVFTASALMVPYLWLSPMVTTWEISRWMDGEHEEGS